MRFVPAPAGGPPDLLGVLVQRCPAAETLTLPAHALAITTVVFSGSLTGADLRLGPGQAGVGGAATASQPFHAEAGLCCASLLCRASVLPHLTRWPAHRFTGLWLEAGEVWGPMPMADWCAMVARGPQHDGDLAAALLAWVAERLVQAGPPERKAAEFQQGLANWALAADGPLLPPAGWGERQWQRACRDQLGVPPKFLQRLGRLHASLRAQGQGPLPWVQAALDAGYWDQSHLVRDYRHLAGVAPSDGADRDSLQLSARQLAPRFFSG
jgi:hypothetical protein